MKRLEPAFDSYNVVVVFSSDETFAPYLSVMIQSVINHVSARRNYDLIVLHKNIADRTQEKMLSEIGDRTNIAIRFFDVTDLINGYNFFVGGKPHFTEEAYFRLLIPEILSDAYTKAVYLDGDMIALEDLAPLYDTDVTGYLLASSRDYPGIAAYHNLLDRSRKRYRDDVLQLKAPDDYFLSGMLVFNLTEFRSCYSVRQLLEIAVSRDWMQHDQDVLNVICDGGRAKMVSAAWDVMGDDCYYKCLPSNLYKEWKTSDESPKIIHYGGMAKPWIYPGVYRGELFWNVAALTPFLYDIILEMHRRSGTALEPKEEVLAQYRRGEAGFRYILKYVRAWLHHKL